MAKSKIIKEPANKEISLEVNEKSKDRFWKQVFVNIMSNFLWKILGKLASFGKLVLLADMCNG